MSRGPGKIERGLLALFVANPSAAFTVEELAEAMYPGVNRVAKKHRVAIIRAARSAASIAGWRTWTSESPGSRLVYLNPLDFRSYATGWLRSEMSWHSCTPQEIAEMLDNPTAHFTHWAKWRPGGAWHYQVLINRAKAAGGDAEAGRLRSQLEMTVAWTLK